MKRWSLLLAAALAALLMLGCATLDEKQRAWIFQPSDRAWGSSAELAQDMDDVWIDFDSRVTQAPARLHGLWLAAGGRRAAQAPVLLFLHGARWNVAGSAPRIRRMQELGFSVLAIDYRGFGKSSAGLPSEASSYEDARAAWDWPPGIPSGRATSSATRWAAPSRSTWPRRWTTSAAPSSKAPSPPSPNWPAP
jgi:hypothetical protein